MLSNGDVSTINCQSEWIVAQSIHFTMPCSSTVKLFEQPNKGPDKLQTLLLLPRSRFWRAQQMFRYFVIPVSQEYAHTFAVINLGLGDRLMNDFTS